MEQGLSKVRHKISTWRYELFRFLYRLFSRFSNPLIVILFIFLGVIALFVLFLPDLLAWIESRAVGAPVAQVNRVEGSRVALDIATFVVQTLGGFFLLANLFFAFNTLRLNEKGQAAERFSQAVSQLGARGQSEPLVETRLGAIYALGKVAQDSARDYWTVMGVLTAYLRENKGLNKKGNEKIRDKMEELLEVGRKKPGPVPADIQAVASVLVLRKIPPYAELRGLNLNQCDLRGVKMHNVNLEGADLRSSLLVRTGLRGAKLGPRKPVELEIYGDGILDRQTRLEGTCLYEAFLDRADLTSAHLDGACLYKASLKRAILRNADLCGACLNHANLTGADLRGACLDHTTFDNETKLEDARLEGVDLSLTTGLTEQQFLSAKRDKRTKAPHFESP